MNDFNLTQHEYETILTNVQFNLKKQEKTIFEMFCKGYKIKQIAKKTHLSERTILYRKKDLFQKINFYLEEKELLKDTYCVYIHKFPNKKVYIGMTTDIKKRWQNGLGYQENSEMFNDILNYGWNNIKHIIIMDNLSYNEAIKLENDKILEYKSYDKKYGYNIKVKYEK